MCAGPYHIHLHCRSILWLHFSSIIVITNIGESKSLWKLSFWILNYHCTFLRIFHTSVSWSSSTGVCEKKSPQVSRTFLVFWPILIMLLFRWSPLVLLFQFFQSLYQSLVIVPSTQTTIGITVTFMFHCYLSGKVQVLISLFAFFQFYSIICLEGKIRKSAGSVFYLFYYH